MDLEQVAPAGKQQEGALGMTLGAQAPRQPAMGSAPCSGPSAVGTCLPQPSIPGLCVVFKNTFIEIIHISFNSPI